MRKILYIVIPVVILFFLGTGIVLYRQEKALLMNETITHVHSQLLILGEMAQLDMMSEDYSHIEEMVLNWGEREENILFAEVKLENGFTIVRYGRRIQGAACIKATETIPLLGKGKLIFNTDYNIEFINERANSLFFNIIVWGTFITFLLIVFLWLIIHRIAVVPLNKLMAGAQKIGQGDLNYSILIKSKDEFGSLASEINLMAKKLQKSFVNVKELKKKESELKAAKENAEQTAARAEELAIRAESANKAKSIFLANMSHELRTPLNAILGFSHLLTGSANLGPEEKRNLAIINRSGSHLLTLINDVLDMSKIEAGRIRLNENDFDLHRLMVEIEDMFRHKSEEKGLQLVFERDSGLFQYIRTDEAKLRQVLVNLVGNAVKFTDAGSVRVEVARTGQRTGLKDFPLKIRFTISDTGDGIEPDEIPLLFDAFEQSKKGRRSSEGSGLGLSISRNFVRLMGGEITVASEIGKGSAFSFEIQAVKSEIELTDIPQPVKKVIALAPDQPRYRILIVDDIEDNRLLLLNILALPGLELREAENGMEAVEIQKKWKPHLIFMDIKMPVMDGYESVRRIRKPEALNSRTCIIAVTANVFNDEQEKVLEAGCDDYISKPFDEQEIFEVMKRHLGVRYIFNKDMSRQEYPGKINQSPHTPADIASLPLEMINRLEQAAILGDSTGVKHMLKEIKSFNSPLAVNLEKLALEFDYAGILKSILAAREISG